MLGVADRLARRWPAPMAELALGAGAWLRARLREGRAFRRLSAELARTEQLSATDLEAWQSAHLRAIVRHAYAHTVYYRELFDSRGIRPADIRTAADLAQLPILTKADLRERPDDFRARRGHGWPVFVDGTSGTSGTPLRVRRDLAAIVHEHAHVARQLRWAGWRPGQRRAWLRGDLFLPIEQSRPPFWRRERGRALLKLSSYHLKEAHLAGYLDALRRFRPSLLQAYPSSAAWLARGLLQRGDSPLPLQAVVTSSETLRADQRTDIERAFQCPVFDWYGTFERVAAIGTCDRGGRHVVSDYGLTELVPDAATGTHRIVGTSWANRAWVLLRYDAGDRVDPHGLPCPCGRAFPTVGEIQGRQDDVVITADGRRVGRLDHVFKSAERLREAQIVQRRPGEVILRFVPEAGFTVKDRERLESAAIERLGPETRIACEAVSTLERGPRGKLQLVVSELSSEERGGIAQHVDQEIRR